ncbi:MAG: RNA methyltransferase [Flavobacteriales bacterium]|nr:RNA methyltransferase [Flavobacteriales bacterium]
MLKEISSTQNTFIKELIQLRDKSRVRKKKSLFLIEGLRELSVAIKGNYTVDQILFLPKIIDVDTIENLFKGGVLPELISISEDVYKKLAYRESTEGTIAIARTKNHSIVDLKLANTKPLILIGESIEKPGNIGAILRTADAANIDAVIIANPKTDLYNPNVIRSSVGCIFTNNVVTGTNEEIISWLKLNNINIYSAALTASKPYINIDFRDASAIVVGTESTGLTSDWLEASKQNIIIPMEGVIDSMNVSVSAAIILFEAKRQRIL